MPLRKASLQPRVIEAYRTECDAPELFPLMGQTGLCLAQRFRKNMAALGASYVAYGLIAREIERVDSGYRSMASVQSSLVMHPIYAYGSEEQRRKYLPGLAAGTLIGCFRVDRAGRRVRSCRACAPSPKRLMVDMSSTVRKTWISNAPFADVFVVWAKSEAHGGGIQAALCWKRA